MIKLKNIILETGSFPHIETYEWNPSPQLQAYLDAVELYDALTPWDFRREFRESGWNTLATVRILATLAFTKSKKSGFVSYLKFAKSIIFNKRDRVVISYLMSLIARRMVEEFEDRVDLKPIGWLLKIDAPLM